ncbi:hypothetical protein [Streptomyces sp. NPDC101393]|uniref:hypothetical protein n=1 Tax=Streptomyces sp. NPDC101393 TaxID=3366141 RepID=UPI00380F53D8
MSKRHMPNLDGLDNGERPVLGVRERAELDDLRSPLLAYGFQFDDVPADEAQNLADLFDSYEE